MLLPKFTILKIITPQSRKNFFQIRFISEKFCNRVSRWDKWSNFLANRFRRSALQIFSLEMFFLKPLLLTWVLNQKRTITSRLTSFDLPRFKEAVLPQMARQIANHNPNLIFTSSPSQKLKGGSRLIEPIRQTTEGLNKLQTNLPSQDHKSGFKLVKHNPQCAGGVNRILSEESRSDGGVKHSSRSLTLPSIERIEKSAPVIQPFEAQIRRIQIPHISEKLLSKEAINIKNPEKNETPTTSGQNDTSRISFSTHAGIKQMSQGDDSRLPEKEYRFSENPSPMVYRKHVPKDIESEKHMRTFPDATGIHTDGANQQRTPSPSVNIDLIADEVIRQIDHKLLIWRERTGKV